MCVCGVYMRVSEREPQSLCGSIYDIIIHIATLLVYIHNIVHDTTCMLLHKSNSLHYYSIGLDLT